MRAAAWVDLSGAVMALVVAREQSFVETTACKEVHALAKDLLVAILTAFSCVEVVLAVVEVETFVCNEVETVDVIASVLVVLVVTVDDKVQTGTESIGCGSLAAAFFRTSALMAALDLAEIVLVVFEVGAVVETFACDEVDNVDV